MGCDNTASGFSVCVHWTGRDGTDWHLREDAHTFDAHLGLRGMFVVRKYAGDMEEDTEGGREEEHSNQQRESNGRSCPFYFPNDNETKCLDGKKIWMLRLANEHRSTFYPCLPAVLMNDPCLFSVVDSLLTGETPPAWQNLSRCSVSSLSIHLAVIGESQRVKLV